MNLNSSFLHVQWLLSYHYVIKERLELYAFVLRYCFTFSPKEIVTNVIAIWDTSSSYGPTKKVKTKKGKEMHEMI